MYIVLRYLSWYVNYLKQQHFLDLKPKYVFTYFSPYFYVDFLLLFCLFWAFGVDDFVFINSTKEA